MDLFSSEKRIFGLDILRFIAIVTVVYVHGASLFPKEYHEFYHSLNIIYLSGVSMFFVLSGYLIGGIIIKKLIENCSLNDVFTFWKRRWFRTIPNYFLILILLLIVKSPQEGLHFSSILSYFFFTQNLIEPMSVNFYPESWSLSVEEWFYIIFPLLILLLTKLKINKKYILLVTCFILIVMPTVYRIYMFEYLELNVSNVEEQMRQVVVYRLDAIGFGVLASYISTQKQLFWFKYRYICFAIVLFILVINTLYHLDLYIYPPLFFNLESIIVLLALPLLSNIKTCRYKGLTFIVTFISIISYSLYLVHFILVRWTILPYFNGFFMSINLNNTLRLCILYGLYLAISIGLSFIIYKYFERPMTKLRDRKLIKTPIAK